MEGSRGRDLMILSQAVQGKDMMFTMHPKYENVGPGIHRGGGS
jgi:hypothetical protein